MKQKLLSTLLTGLLLPGLLQPAAADARLPELARKQIGVTVNYDPDYTVLPYPGGDVPLERGVCTDVVIRALRELGLDLQKAVHEDMRSNFSAYPKLWGLKRPDRNIDHRRVPNLQTYFRRRGWELPVTDKPEDYRPGDIVTSRIDAALFHILIVSDRQAADGTPGIIHHIGAGPQEEEGLFFFPLTGHYRLKL